MDDSSKVNGKELVISISRDVALPDNTQWVNRFEIRSSSSNRIYIIAQNRTKRHFGCSCPSWKIRRSCKHLTALGLPGHELPVDNVRLLLK